MSLATPYFTLEQVAAELHKTKAWLQEWLSRHPYDANGTPFYRKAGRTKLFRRSDIDRIYASLEAPCPLPLSRPGRAIRTGRSVAATSMSGDYIALQKLLTDGSPRSSSSGSSGRSKVVSLLTGPKKPSAAPR
jgi:hypothetical protein